MAGGACGNAFVRNAGAVKAERTVRVRLTNPDGSPAISEALDATLQVDPGSERTVDISAPVPAPDPWTAETPALYTLSLELLDESGNTTEALANRVGFRDVRIADGQ